MTPTKAVILGLFLNVSAVLVMERVKSLWRGAPAAFEMEAWLWYAVIAVAIVGAQFCIIWASLSDALPMFAVISGFIAVVLTFSMLNGCRTSGRWPTLLEGLALAAFLATAFAFQLVSSRAEKAHRERLGGSVESREG
ncbi:MAG: hypothetical protein AB7G28_08180 [Pirellulales bacterium]